jgi:16S rRNA (adenine1518-N6/adenine1519-N6)-dimethyltransferase
MARISGIALKKEYGQHFLTDDTVVDTMLSAVVLDKTVSVFEIGPGSGFLTRAILEYPVKKLWSFEIDPEWAQYLEKQIQDPRCTIFNQDFMTTDKEMFLKESQWTVLANLPYNITFPVLERFVALRSVISEGVIMIQEEVAQKLVAQSGRSYGAVSIFFQYFFDFQLMIKIGPEAFTPPPKVYSRLLYFKPRKDAPSLKNEKEFFRFVRLCFKQPRRTLKNNLFAAHIPYQNIDEKTLRLRAQQLNMNQLIEIFYKLF